MTYVAIDTTTKQGQKFVELLETLPFAKILKEPNEATQKAIAEARRGKAKKVASLDQLFDELGK